MVDESPDRALMTLAEAAKLIPDADARTLKRRARQGKLVIYRPGKQFLTTRADLMAMIEACRVKRPDAPQRTSPLVPNGLGLTEPDLAGMALDRALASLSTSKRRR
jgi:hypothetical protein